MKKCILILICFFSAYGLYSQSDISIGKTREVVVSKMDSVLRFNILEKPSGISPEVNKTYYWYSQKQVHFNQGGFYGKLLHGSYFLFDAEQRLIENGDFKEGLKVGEWFRWHTNGKIAVQEEWEDGLLNGKTITYNNKGGIISVEVYKNGYKHGRQRYYSEGGRPTKQVDYRKGEKHGKEILFIGKEQLAMKYKRGVLKKKKVGEEKVRRTPLMKQENESVLRSDPPEVKDALNDDSEKGGFYKKIFSSRKKRFGDEKEGDVKSDTGGNRLRQINSEN